MRRNLLVFITVLSAVRKSYLSDAGSLCGKGRKNLLGMIYTGETI